MEYIKIAKVNNVLLQKGRHAYLGTLHLTAQHLIFKYQDQDQEIWIFYSTIHNIDKRPPNAQGHIPLYISCRNFLFIRLLIYSESNAQDVYDSLLKLIHIGSPSQLFAFTFKPTTTFQVDGWAVYDVREEYGRMGVLARTDGWRFSDANYDYSLCPTYPKILVVPTRISDNVLKYAAKFRSKSRIPALSYLHRTNNASITRCSQPLVGLKQNRSIQDEKYIEAIWAINEGTDNLIVDARPTANAMANTAKGAGTENMENYKGFKKIYIGIDNIHVMRDSLTKMVEAVQQADSQGTSLNKVLLNRSGWLKHIKMCLDGTETIVEAIENNSNVVVHCSDGWDRTSQLVSLAQLCLDPFYRTIRGFEVLLEKDWISFGHKFSERCGHLSTDYTSSSISASNAASAAIQKVQNKIYKQAEIRETSPVFHQFLDCVYQLWTQHPTRFEFNERFLIQLHFHVYSCQFGTFLFNCEMEREVYRVRKTTHSLWSMINSNATEYLNPVYDAQKDREHTRGVLKVETKWLRYWTGLVRQSEEDLIDLVVCVDEIGASTTGSTDNVSVAGSDTPEDNSAESAVGNTGNLSTGIGIGLGSSAVTTALGNTGTKVVQKIGNLWNKYGLGSGIGVSVGLAPHGLPITGPTTTSSNTQIPTSPSLPPTLPLQSYSPLTSTHATSSISSLSNQPFPISSHPYLPAPHKTSLTSMQVQSSTGITPESSISNSVLSSTATSTDPLSSSTVTTAPSTTSLFSFGHAPSACNDIPMMSPKERRESTNLP